jgi:hypothetical protein
MRSAIIVILFAIFVSGCSARPDCQNEVQDRSISPDGTMAAIVFSRNCGATMGDSYHVSVVPSGEAAVGAGNILVADQVPPYSNRFKPAWSGNANVVVPIPPGARTFATESSVYGVDVTFR